MSTMATISGHSIGSLYAVSAAGIVVVYTTTGTFNFAHGGIDLMLIVATAVAAFGQIRSLPPRGKSTIPHSRSAFA